MHHSIAWRKILLLTVLPLVSALCVRADAWAPNSWTSAGSGAWEDLSWSAGILPGAGQLVLITNAGSKTVTISTITAQSFPQTMNPYAIVVSSSGGSQNTLLLDNPGFLTPLAVHQIVINSNATVTALGAAVNVDTLGGLLSVGGALNQGASSTISAGRFQIGDVGAGVYNLTNGILSVADTELVGGAFPGYFNQFGGTNYAFNVQLFSGGEYDLFGGSLITSNLVYKPLNVGSSAFNQWGGLVAPDKLYVTFGTYRLASGSFASADIELPGVITSADSADFGNFLQTGGTNHSESINIGTYRPPYANSSAFGNYTLSNGVLATTQVTVGPYGGFSQFGGAHTNGVLGLHGDNVYYGAAAYAAYSLSNGILSSSDIGMSIATFNQSGGTNQVTGNLTLGVAGYYGSLYKLGAGTLISSNTIVIGSPYSGSGFVQSGGMHVVANLLTVSMASLSSPGYVLSGGQLNSHDIQVDSGATFRHAGGTLVQNGLLTLANGTWQANAGDQQFGKLALGISVGSNSTLSLPAGPAALHFADSSQVNWPAQAVLIIQGWNGSVAGGGTHQVYFGADGVGLTPQQLSQVQFQNPAGAGGLYPATMLSSGEIVPAQFLACQKAGPALVLSWPASAILQTSTNALGPFVDLPEARSPYTPSCAEPQRFFRLRQVSVSPNVMLGSK